MIASLAWAAFGGYTPVLWGLRRNHAARCRGFGRSGGPVDATILTARGGAGDAKRRRQVILGNQLAGACAHDPVQLLAHPFGGRQLAAIDRERAGTGLTRTRAGVFARARRASAVGPSSSDVGPTPGGGTGLQRSGLAPGVLDGSAHEAVGAFDQACGAWRACRSRVCGMLPRPSSTPPPAVGGLPTNRIRRPSRLGITRRSFSTFSVPGKTGRSMIMR